MLKEDCSQAHKLIFNDLPFLKLDRFRFRWLGGSSHSPNDEDQRKLIANTVQISVSRSRTRALALPINSAALMWSLSSFCRCRCRFCCRAIAWTRPIASSNYPRCLFMHRSPGLTAELSGEWFNANAEFRENCIRAQSMRLHSAFCPVSNCGGRQFMCAHTAHIRRNNHKNRNAEETKGQQTAAFVYIPCGFSPVLGALSLLAWLRLRALVSSLRGRLQIKMLWNLS